MGRAGWPALKTMSGLTVKDMVVLTEAAIRISGEEFGDGYLFYQNCMLPEQAEVFLYRPAAEGAWWRAEVPERGVGCWVPPEIGRMALAFPEFHRNVRRQVLIRYRCPRTGQVKSVPAWEWKTSGGLVMIFETTAEPHWQKVLPIPLNLLTKESREIVEQKRFDTSATVA
ncbi:hypothetical protein E308F_17400 [Moorella sp. E308F]|nr:hypothetical protein E308F_17400 [Moorella sp. E308F]GEA19646.1 hypothetical protein E306M_27840 [Moorella sp. E306M]